MVVRHVKSRSQRILLESGDVFSFPFVCMLLKICSFDRHLRHWKFFESQMKAWPTWWRKTVLEQILYVLDFLISLLLKYIL